MRNIRFSALGAMAAMLICYAHVYARDTTHYFDLSQALKTKEAKNALDPSISFMFGKGSGDGHEIIAKNLVANKRTNRVGKTKEKACTWALLSALKTFQARAIREGGSKVVNLVGYFRKREYNDTEQFQCVVGNIMAAVTLRGDIAK